MDDGPAAEGSPGLGEFGQGAVGAVAFDDLRTEPAFVAGQGIGGVGAAEDDQFGGERAQPENLLTALRPIQLTVPQYACLELLGQRPGLSNAEPARGAFVTRQSMNGVLRGLQERGLLTRPATALLGRALPTQLTSAGRERLHTASTAVRAVERHMLTPLPQNSQVRLRNDFASCAAALTPHTPQSEDNRSK